MGRDAGACCPLKKLEFWQRRAPIPYVRSPSLPKLEMNLVEVYLGYGDGTFQNPAQCFIPLHQRGRNRGCDRGMGSWILSRLEILVLTSRETKHSSNRSSTREVYICNGFAFWQA